LGNTKSLFSCLSRKFDKFQYFVVCDNATVGTYSARIAARMLSMPDNTREGSAAAFERSPLGLGIVFPNLIKVMVVMT
jgi:hypothetical protein